MRLAARLHFIFKIPIEFGPTDDGVREADQQFQRDIDSEIDTLYADLARETVEIRGTVKERASAVLSHLASNGYPQFASFVKSA